MQDELPSIASLLEVVRSLAEEVSSLTARVALLETPLERGDATSPVAALDEDEKHPAHITEMLRLRDEFDAGLSLEFKQRYYPDLFPPMPPGAAVTARGATTARSDGGPLTIGGVPDGISFPLDIRAARAARGRRSAWLRDPRVHAVDRLQRG